MTSPCIRETCSGKSMQLTLINPVMMKCRAKPSLLAMPLWPESDHKHHDETIVHHDVTAVQLFENPLRVTGLQWQDFYSFKTSQLITLPATSATSIFVWLISLQAKITSTVPLLIFLHSKISKEVYIFYCGGSELVTCACSWSSGADLIRNLAI